MQKLGVLLAIMAISGAGLLPSAFAQTCVELSNCPINGTTPLQMALMPYTSILGDWVYLVIWGTVVVIFAVRYSAMYAALVGMFLAAFLATSTTIFQSGAGGEAQYWGIVLAALSIGSGLFFLIRWKANNP